MLTIFDKNLFSEILQGFPAEQGDEEFLSGIGMMPEQFFNIIWDRVVSEPPVKETVNPDKVKEFFQEELCEIVCNLNKKNQERLYDIFRGGFLHFAHRWGRLKKIKEDDESQTTSEIEFSFSIKKTRKKTIVRKHE